MLIAGGIGLLAAATLVIAVYQRAAALDRRQERSAAAPRRRRCASARRTTATSTRIRRTCTRRSASRPRASSTATRRCSRRSATRQHEIIGSNVGVLYHGDHREAKDGGEAGIRRDRRGARRGGRAPAQGREQARRQPERHLAARRGRAGRVGARGVARHQRAQAGRPRSALPIPSSPSCCATRADRRGGDGAGAAERLAQHLKVARCLFAEVESRRDVLIVRRDYHAPPSDEGAAPDPVIQRGDDRGAARRTDDDQPRHEPGSANRPAGRSLSSDRHARADLGAAAAFREGSSRGCSRWVPTIRAMWQDREVSLAQIVAERTWVWVEQLRASDALRQSEARKAAILDSSFDAIVLDRSPRRDRRVQSRRGAAVRPRARRRARPADGRADRSARGCARRTSAVSPAISRSARAL